jgi:integrase
MKTQTRRMAERIEDEHRQMRYGYKPLPKVKDPHALCSLHEIVTAYIAWGKSQGGRGGRAWSPPHTCKRQRQLVWWRESLGIEELGDLVGCLPKVEAALRMPQGQGRTGKTRTNYAETLRAFCRWCVERGYLPSDPLAKLKGFDTTPPVTRRALSIAEIQRLLDHCPVDQHLLLETAFCSGLRVGELRRLGPKHCDRRRCGLHLESAWTKNRRPGFQPLPSILVELTIWVETGEARRLYAINYERAGAKSTYPDDPLLYVPSDPARSLDWALKAAGISKVTETGKVDFHAYRVAYITMLFENGATLKEAQELARHITPHLTTNVYAKVRDERLAGLVEQVGAALVPTAKHAHRMHHRITRTDNVSVVSGDTDNAEGGI